jgi:hypothetical protein
MDGWMDGWTDNGGHKMSSQAIDLRNVVKAET